MEKQVELRAGSFAVVNNKKYKFNGRIVLIKSVGVETALTENGDGQLNNLPLANLKPYKY